MVKGEAGTATCGNAAGDQEQPLFKVLREVPAILDFIPEADLAEAAASCWAMLLAVLRFGVRTRGVETCLHPLTCFHLHLSMDRKAPVLKRLGRALLEGLAQRIDPSEPYVARICFAGAQLPVSNARTLHEAARGTGAFADENYHDLHHLEQMLAAASAATGPAALRVLQWRMPVINYDAAQPTFPRNFRSKAITKRAIEHICSLLETPAVLRNIEFIAFNAGPFWSAAMPRILDVLCAAPALRVVDVSEIDLGSTGGAAVAKLLRECETLQSLNVSHTKLPGNAAVAVAQACAARNLGEMLFDFQPAADDVAAALTQCGDTMPKTLSIGGTDMTAVGVSHVARHMAKGNNVVNLWLHSPGMGALAEGLASNTSLRVLCLGDTKLGPDDAVRLCRAIAGNTAMKLEVLDLCLNPLGAVGTQAVAQMLEASRSLAKLNLKEVKVGNAGLQRLGEALTVNASLQTLKMSRPGGSASGLCAFLRGLASNATLRALDLDFVWLRDKATRQALGELLARNSALHSLSLVQHYNKKESLYTDELAEGLKTNTALRNLDLSGRVIGIAGAKKLAAALRENTTLQSLILDVCGIRSKGGVALADALKRNAASNLCYLSLGANVLGDDCARAFAELLRTNRRLMELGLGGNSITDAGARVIVEAYLAREFPEQAEVLLWGNEISAEGYDYMCKLGWNVEPPCGWNVQPPDS
ncbi:unnamed protein product [Pedinophyceae sp. YPF-701]|nr:unnamed protein product [Pedinophyceae sp. YPF-701]